MLSYFIKFLVTLFWQKLGVVKLAQKNILSKTSLYNIVFYALKTIKIISIISNNLIWFK